MLHELTHLILPDARPMRVCEACDRLFACGASLAGCWCMSIKLGAEMRHRLRERYKDCLCRDCLLRFTQEAQQFTEAQSDEQSK